MSCYPNVEIRERTFLSQFYIMRGNRQMLDTWYTVQWIPYPTYLDFAETCSLYSVQESDTSDIQVAFE